MRKFCDFSFLSHAGPAHTPQTAQSCKKPVLWTLGDFSGRIFSVKIQNQISGQKKKETETRLIHAVPLSVVTKVVIF